MHRASHRYQQMQSGIFLAQRLDDPNQLETAGQFEFFAQAIAQAPGVIGAHDMSKMRTDLPVGPGKNGKSFEGYDSGLSRMLRSRAAAGPLPPRAAPFGAASASMICQMGGPPLTTRLAPYCGYKIRLHRHGEHERSRPDHFRSDCLVALFPVTTACPPQFSLGVRGSVRRSIGALTSVLRFP